MNLSHWIYLGLGCMAAAVVVQAAPFPASDQLPDRPELPDPLTTFDGQKVTSAEQWRTARRPELLQLFQHYMYGQLPNPPAAVTARVLHSDPKAFDGKGNLSEIELTVGPAEAPKMHVLLVLPNAVQPAPIFVGLNFCGNHAIVKDPKVRIPTVWMYANRPGVVANRATEAGRGTQADVWSIEQIVKRGYGLATVYSGEIDPDQPTPREGLRPFILTNGKPAECGTIMAWAWGIMRIVDHLMTNKSVDTSRIAVVGHSRLGKTALLAAAFDERIALAIPSQAGCGGTAPSRGKVGESVKAINDRFPHWFNAEFKKFNDKPSRLPFDQHCLIACVAPRPVLLPNAVEDTWANPEGQFEVLRAAEPVYKLLGAGGLQSEKLPAINQLSAGVLGYHLRPGKHSMGLEDWKVFLDFADKHLAKK